MNEHRLPHDQSLPRALRVDSACDAFETAWQAGARPNLAAVLEAAAGVERDELLKELLPIDLHYRAQHGERPAPSDYINCCSADELAWVASLIDQQSLLATSQGLGETLATADSLQRASQPSSHGSTPNVAGYQILGELGRGGMGVVYKAWQAGVDRVVALKMVLAGGHAGADQLARFRAEVQAVARFQHPNIVHVYDFGEHQGCPYFTLEYVDGGTLAQKIAGVPQSPRDAARLIETLARAIHHAHQAEVVHRDLKPANVLLTRDGVPKITDFGLAKIAQSDHAATASGTLLGTPQYMAPEQASGNSRFVGPATDIYALGAILYELLTGRPPFQAATLTALLQRIAEGEPCRPRLIKQSVPRDLETICLKCLQLSPSGRYVSAAALAEDLQRFLAGQPITARPVTSVERLWRWCYRNPWLAGALSAVAAALVFATAMSMRYASSEHLRAQQELHAKHELEQQAKTIKVQAETLRAEHDEGQRQLAKALIANARAQRMSGRPGQRYDALRRIAEAYRITGATRELADEATAALSLPDWEVEFEWDGYPEGTRRLCLSAGFDRYARVDFEGQISVRTLPDDREVARLKAADNHVDYGGLRFSDGGRFLFEHYAANMRARAWDLRSDPPRLIVDQSSLWVDSWDDRHLVVANSAELIVQDADNQEANRSIALGAQHRDIFARCRFGASRSIWRIGDRWRSVDLESGEVGPLHVAPSPFVAWPAASRDARLVLWTFSSQRGTALFDTATGRHVAPPFQQHLTEGIIGELSPCGTAAFTIDWHGILRFWDPRNGRPLLQRPSVNQNNWLVVSRDGQRIGPEISGAKARWLRFESGAEHRVLALDANNDAKVSFFSGFALSPDGRLLACVASSGLTLVDTAAGLPLAHLAKYQGANDQALRFLEDGTLVSIEAQRFAARRITCQEEGALQIGPKSIIVGAGTLPSGITVQASCSSRGDVQGIPQGIGGLLLTHSWTKLGPTSEGSKTQMLAPGEDIRSCSISPDGRWIAAGSHGEAAANPRQNAQVWRTDNGERVALLEIPALCQVQFSPDGRFLVAHSGMINECRVYNTESWTRHAAFLSKSPGVFSPDEQLFAVEQGPGEISLRRGPDLREFARLSSPEEHTFRPLGFAPDNSRFYAHNVDTQRIHVWNLARLRQGLESLRLAAEWPEISLASSPRVLPPPLLVKHEPVESAKPGSKSKSAGSSVFDAHDRAIAAATSDEQRATLTLARAQLKATHAQWDSAVEDLKYVIDVLPDQEQAYYQLLALLAFRRDEHGFRAYSAVITQRFAERDLPPANLASLAKACLLAPQWCADLDQVRRMAARAVAAYSNGPPRLDTVGLAHAWDLVRRKDPAADALLQRLLEAASPTDPRRAQAHLLRSLARAQSQRWDGAIAQRLLGLNSLSSLAPPAKEGERSRALQPLAPWHETLTNHLLIAEINAVIPNEFYADMASYTARLGSRTTSRIPQTCAHFAAQRAYWETAEYFAKQAKLQEPASTEGTILLGAILAAQSRGAVEYLELCRQTTARWSESRNYYECETAAKLCVLAPHPEIDLEAALHLADRAILLDTNGEIVAWSRLSKALLLFRKGQFAAAEQTAGECLDQFATALRDKPFYVAQAHLTRGLARAALRERATAQASLASARNLCQNHSPPSHALGDHWIDWQLAWRLRLELELAVLVE